ncbi:MAG TPA: hypothetical protein ENN95_02540 [Deltaproteobacteria bacterium]|nr:hypothetical protein [Deltaproteobacteria bacterium]
MQVHHQNSRSRISKRALLLFFFFLLSILASCALKEMIVEKPASPEGIWTYPGGSAEPMSLAFYPDGKLVFVGGFKKFNPATWHYDPKTQRLYIRVSNYEKNDTDCSGYGNAAYACISYNRKNDVFECKWTPKTKSLSFLGWNFLRK